MLLFLEMESIGRHVGGEETEGFKIANFYLGMHTVQMDRLGITGTRHSFSDFTR